MDLPLSGGQKAFSRQLFLGFRLPSFSVSENAEIKMKREPEYLPF